MILGFTPVAKKFARGEKAGWTRADDKDLNVGGEVVDLCSFERHSSFPQGSAIYQPAVRLRNEPPAQHRRREPLARRAAAPIGPAPPQEGLHAIARSCVKARLSL